MSTRSTTVTLTATTVASVTLDQLYRVCEVEMGATTPGDVYFTVDGSTPTVKGANCWMLAGVGGTTKRVMIPPKAWGQGQPDPTPITVNLISAGTPTVTVSGVA